MARTLNLFKLIRYFIIYMLDIYMILAVNFNDLH